MSATKLVRDRISELIVAQGGNPKTHIADTSEYEVRLLEKLREETEEFIEGKNIEELADLCEVITAVQYFYNWSSEELSSVQVAKRDKRGGFEKRIILEQQQ